MKGSIFQVISDRGDHVPLTLSTAVLLPLELTADIVRTICYNIICNKMLFFQCYHNLKFQLVLC